MADLLGLVVLVGQLAVIGWGLRVLLEVRDLLRYVAFVLASFEVVSLDAEGEPGSSASKVVPLPRGS